MDSMAQTGGLQFAPVTHKLTPYDTPARPDESPESRARQAAKDEESHPFIHYLAQFVPGLVPRPQAPDPDKLLGERTDALATVLAPASKGPEPRKDDTRDANRDVLAGLGAIQPPPVVLAPIAPVVADEPRAVTPAAVPQLIAAQVQRLQTDGIPATQIRVQLDPPDLGKLDLAFTYAQEKVSVNIVAATAQAKEHLDLQLGAIRNILSQHHLQTGELKVVLGQKTGSQGGSGDREGGGNGSNAAPGQAMRRRKRPSLDEDVAI